MKHSIISILFFTLLLIGCTIQPTKQVYYGPGTFYAKWQKQVLDECSDKAALVALEIVKEKSKEGMLITENDVVNLHEYLIKKCSMSNGIVI